MFRKNLLLTSCCISIALLSSPAFATEDSLPTREEMWAMIQMQQKQIDALQQQVQGQNKKIVATDIKIEKTAEIAEATQEEMAELEVVAQQAVQNIAAIAPAAGGSGWAERTKISHYGELHYNGGDVDEIDLHRFVLGLHHEFTEDVRFVGEIEIEHALSGEGNPGEVEIEQAYIEFDLTKDDAHRAKAGVFLMPVGILNERHEPNAFFGTERNNVEKNILPTTWWEAGAALSGNLGQSGLSYDLAVHSGLQTPTTGTNAYKIRNGRQKAAEAEATDPAFTGRLRWTGYPGVALSLSTQYQTDVSQDSGADGNIDAFLVEAHADIRRGGWGLRALYADWHLNGNAPETTGRDRQYGWYIEPSYRFEVPLGFDDGYGELGFFARYSQYDNNAGSSTSTTDFDQTDFGLNYWPIEQVVLKADYSIIEGPSNGDDDSILNLGVGWSF
jgi:hypothetical protein